MRALLLGLLLLPMLPASASAGPVELGNAAPRWVEIAFEVSPRDRPGQVDTHYTERIRAWLDGAGDGRVRITVDRRDVERTLVAADGPVAGSFSDFVWIFDAESGEVLSASLSGELEKELDWGLFDSKVRTAIEVEMATRDRVGYKPAKRMMGQEFFASCRAGDDARCTPVRASVYDPARGYVNAVGDLRVRFGDIVLDTFSPLGEARLFEIESAAATSAAPRVALPAAMGSAFAPVSATGASQWIDAPAVSAGPPTAH